MPSRDLVNVVGKIGTLNVRLASWRPPSGVDQAYTRRYVPVKPEDRFVPGQQFEFTADLEMRDWVIDDFSGGLAVGKWWSPDSGQVYRAERFRLAEGLKYEPSGLITYTVTDGGGTPTRQDSTTMFVAGGKLWTGKQVTIYEWQPTTNNWDDTGLATGATNDIASAADVGDGNVYTAHDDEDIRQRRCC